MVVCARHTGACSGGSARPTDSVTEMGSKKYQRSFWSIPFHCSLSQTTFITCASRPCLSSPAIASKLFTHFRCQAKSIMTSSVHGVRAHIDALRDEIEANLVMSISQRRFLPMDKSRGIFTLPAVKDAVQELDCKREDRINLANTIYHNGRVLFAMLIDNWKEDLIVDFRKHGVLDNQLPLDQARAQEIVGPAIAHRLVSEVQWKFLPFVFPERMWECQLYIPDPMILPFVSCEQIGFGAFGEVDRIGISPSQQNFSDKRVSGLICS